MISLTVGKNGDILAEQQLRSPSVYLDHWALRKLSDDKQLGQAVTAALKNRGGTLTVSWANIAEFPAVNMKTARRAEEFIDSNRPHIFLLDFNPFDVIKREEQLLVGCTRDQEIRS